MKVQVCALIGSLLILASPCVWAQAGEEALPSEPMPAKRSTKNEQVPNTPNVKVERGRGGRKVFRITESWVIEGRIQKPNAFYVLQRSQINYDWAAMKQNFLPKITDALSNSPF